MSKKYKNVNVFDLRGGDFMTNNIKYVHTNIIARDWKRLAQFYIDVFNCKPLLPERNLSGEWLDKLTKIDDAKIRGMHLSLPGYEDGPTLEIFEYEPSNPNCKKTIINQQGLAHLAFLVDSVEQVLDNTLKNGGEQLGELITKRYDGIGVLTAVYARDPEGNLIEIQNWEK
jgi:predicted enzyme related to lactoylglutathione lyase